MPDDYTYADPFLAAATTGPDRPRRDALAPVAGVIDSRVHTVPAITRRREEVAYTGPDPLLMRACETICASIGLSIHAAGALPSGMSADEHLGTAIAAGVRNGVTAASCDLAAELEALRSTVAAARERRAAAAG